MESNARLPLNVWTVSGCDILNWSAFVYFITVRMPVMIDDSDAGEADNNWSIYRCQNACVSDHLGGFDLEWFCHNRRCFFQQNNLIFFAHCWCFRNESVSPDACVSNELCFSKIFKITHKLSVSSRLLPQIGVCMCLVSSFVAGCMSSHGTCEDYLKCYIQVWNSSLENLSVHPECFFQTLFEVNRRWTNGM